MEREVNEDLHTLITVDTNEAVGASEDVENDDRKDEGRKKKKGKKQREKEKEGNQEKDEVRAKKATKKRDKKSKEEADQEFLMKYVLLTLLDSSMCCTLHPCRDRAGMVSL